MEDKLAIEGIEITETAPQITNKVKISVVGVGGGGGNMISHILNNTSLDVELIALNTDAQALNHLESSKKAKVFQIGKVLTKGLGAGMKPEIGRNSALENEDEIKELLNGSDIVFISAGLGGGTGTGASPIIAKIAKEVGALTVSVVTKPFLFEGKKRAILAEKGLQELKNSSDSIIVIPNNKLLKIIDRKLGLKESFKMVDEVLAQAVLGTSGIVLSSGNNDINLDFADLQTVMSHQGTALMGTGEFEGEDAAVKAVEKAIDSPLLDDTSVKGAMGILVHFSTHPNYSMMDLSEAMNIVEDTSDENADVIFGTTTDSSLSEDYVKVTLIATGFEKKTNNHFMSNFHTKHSVRHQKETNEDYLDIPSYLRG